MALSVDRAAASELDAVRAIRRTVFVEEQAVPVEIERDGLDEVAEHFLARLGSQPVATARARRTSKGWKLERVAVLGAQRRMGIGLALVRHVLALAPPSTLVYVHAQQSALGFWQRAGFVAEGPAFEEGGIVHRWMRLVPPGSEASTGEAARS
jgi:predicted GNAT family N-acyltransferase